VGLESVDRFLMYLTTQCYWLDYVAVGGTREEEYCSRFGKNVLQSDHGLYYLLSRTEEYRVELQTAHPISCRTEGLKDTKIKCWPLTAYVTSNVCLFLVVRRLNIFPQLHTLCGVE